MIEIMKRLLDAADAFAARNRRVLFTVVARVLAISCVLVAAYYAWKAYGALTQ